MTIHQISVFLENRAGQLAEITSVLARHNIDLRAINIAETTDYGVLRLIADKPQEAASVLLEQGFILSMTPVLAVSVPDEPGGLARVLEVLARENIDVEYMYSVFGQVDGRAHMNFRVADVETLDAVLRASGIVPAEAGDLGVQ